MSRPAMSTKTYPASWPLSFRIIAGPRRSEMRELPHRHLRPGGRRNEDACELVEVVAEVARVSGRRWYSVRGLRRRRDGLAADGGRDEELRVLDREPVAGERAPVEVEVDVVAAGGALGDDVPGAGDRWSSASMRVATSWITVRSGPSTLMPIGVRMPVDSMSMRFRIGIVQMFGMPGEAELRVHLVLQRLERHARPPLGLGLQTTVVSTIENGAGSVGEFARPALPNTDSTSGKSRRMRSWIWSKRWAS
jgi:hypothetical protein